MFIDDGIENENDARFQDALSRRARPVRRPKARRRNTNTARTKATPAAPGGIRQRRNKRWAW